MGGFTLTELLITIGVFVIVAGISVPLFVGFKQRHSFELDAENVVAVIRNAQDRAVFGEGASAWGVRFTNSTSTNDYYEVFSGSVYATSSVILSEQLSSASSFTNPISGTSTVVIFTAITGVPDNAQSIMIKRSGGDDLINVIIGSNGKVTKRTETGLVGYWPMDEASGTNIYDATSYGSNGSFYDAPLWSETSRGGYGLNFDGSNDRVTISDSSAWDLITNEISICAWIRPDTGSTSSRRDIVARHGSADDWWLNLQDGGKVSFYAQNITGGVYKQSSGTVSENQWSHVVTTYNGSLVTFFINGTFNSTSTASGSFIVSSNGVDISAGNGPFDGIIDDVRVYNRALSSSEVQALYESY